MDSLGQVANTVRGITSYPRSEEDEAKTNNVWLNAHAGMLRSSLSVQGFLPPNTHRRQFNIYSLEPARISAANHDSQRRVALGEACRQCGCVSVCLYLDVKLLSEFALMIDFLCG